MNEQNIKGSISALKKILQKRFGSEMEFYLFGSVARNNYEPDSDIDILVLVPGKVILSKRWPNIGVIKEISVDFFISKM